MTDHDKSTLRAKDSTQAAQGQDSVKQGHVAPDNARAFPPNDTVDVPNLPKAVEPSDRARATPDSADAAQSNPDVDTTEHSWADTTQPAPDKKNARSSIL